MDLISGIEWRRLRAQLLKRYGLWITVLPLAVLGISITIADYPEYQILFSALGVSAGFVITASTAGPNYGFGVALLLLSGAFLGSIPFAGAVGITVATIGVAKLRRLDAKCKDKFSDPP